MLPPVENIQGFPGKCPFPGCRAKLYREWVLGVIPKFLGTINTVIRCNNCERVYAFTMPVAAVEPFIASLPLDPKFPFDITKRPSKEPISAEEVTSFGRKRILPKDVKHVMEAFAILDEYDALGYYGTDQKTDDTGNIE